jgi:hypothetical protein
VIDRVFRSPTATRALARFHLRAGARVALRANAALLGIVVFIFGSAPAPDALLTFERFMIGIVARSPTSGPRMLFAGIAAALGATAVPRVTLGTAGWMRSLPTDARTRRHAAVVAVTAAQAIIAIALVLFAVSVRTWLRVPLDWARVLSVPVLMVAIAGALLPRQRVALRLLDLAAVVACVAGTLATLLLAIVLLAFSNTVSPGVDAPATARRESRPADLASQRVRSPRLIWMRATWRAIGWRRFIDAALAAALPCAFAYFITRNNPELSAATVRRVARICCAIALVAFGTTSTNALLAGRQPWPWARSLPWSAAERVRADAIVLGTPLLTVIIVLAPLHWPSALAMACVVPMVAVVCTGALRGASTKQYGAAGLCLALAAPATVLVAAWPALCAIALVATVPAFRWASARERDPRAAQWAELRHSAAGDPLWISRA